MLMSEKRQEPESRQGGLAAVGVGALAIGCCAGGPLIAALVGSLAVGALIGIGAAMLLLVPACTVVYLRRRSGPGKPRALP